MQIPLIDTSKFIGQEREIVLCWNDIIEATNNQDYTKVFEHLVKLDNLVEAYRATVGSVPFFGNASGHFLTQQASYIATINALHVLMPNIFCKYDKADEESNRPAYAESMDEGKLRQLQDIIAKCFANKVMHASPALQRHIMKEEISVVNYLASDLLAQYKEQLQEWEDYLIASQNESLIEDMRIKFNADRPLQNPESGVVYQLSQRMRVLQSVFQEWESATDNLKTKQAKLGEAVSIAAFAEAASELERLEAKQSESRMEIAGLRTEIRSINGQIEGLDSVLKQLNAKFRSIRHDSFVPSTQKYHIKLPNLDNLDEEIEILQASVDHDNSKSVDYQIGHWEKELGKLTSEKSEWHVLRKEILNLQTEKRNLEREIMQLEHTGEQDKFAAAKEKLAKVEDAIKSLSELYAESLEKIKQVTDRIQEYRQELHRYEEKSGQLSEKTRQGIRTSFPLQRKDMLESLKQYKAIKMQKDALLAKKQHAKENLVAAKKSLSSTETEITRQTALKQELLLKVEAEQQLVEQVAGLSASADQTREMVEAKVDELHQFLEAVGHESSGIQVPESDVRAKYNHAMAQAGAALDKEGAENEVRIAVIKKEAAVDVGASLRLGLLKEAQQILDDPNMLPEQKHELLQDNFRQLNATRAQHSASPKEMSFFAKAKGFLKQFSFLTAIRSLFKLKGPEIKPVDISPVAQQPWSRPAAAAA